MKECQFADHLVREIYMPRDARAGAKLSMSKTATRRSSHYPQRAYLIDLTLYSDYSGSTIHRANHEDLRARYAEHIIDLYDGCGAHAIAILSTCNNIDLIAEVNSLADYPLLNDVLLCEIEEWIKADYFNNSLLRDIERAVERDRSIEITEWRDTGALYSAIYESIEIQDAISAYCNLDRLLERFDVLPFCARVRAEDIEDLDLDSAKYHAIMRGEYPQIETSDGDTVQIPDYIVVQYDARQVALF